MKIKVFLFHRVSPQRDLLWDPISPENFEKILRVIVKNHTVIQLESRVLGTHTDETGKPLAAIVFDDGYRDFAQVALPLLKKYDCPASMYVVTGCIENQLPPWTYVLDYHFTHSKKLEVRLEQELLPEALHQKKFNTISSRLEFARQFKPYLKTVSNDTRELLYRQLLTSLDDVSPPTNLIMSWKELKEIQNEGVVIGSHTCTHPLLNKIEKEATILDELKGSGKLIEQHLGKFPFTISYPIGGYNDRVKKLAEISGYKMGLAVNQCMYNSSHHSRFEIPRIELYNDSMLKNRMRMSGVISTARKFLNV